MNDLLTKSFLSYAELKKQAEKDLESDLDVENGLGKGKLNPTDENLSRFFQEVASIKITMEEITNLVFDLQNLNEETESTHSAKLLRGLRDRMESDTVSILRKAKMVKEKLESLDRSNASNRRLSDAYKEGTEDLRRIYYNATGEFPVQDMLEKAGKVEMDSRHEAVMDMQRSLQRLNQAFLDMAVLVEAHGEKMDDIEENVANGGDFISGGTNQIEHANQMKKTAWVWGVVLIILLVCIISMEKAGDDGCGGCREDQPSVLTLVMAVAPALHMKWPSQAGFLPFVSSQNLKLLAFLGRRFS
ncbi:hypothetical protein V6N11_015351 [Hibiscus sabdariffa]|uniref:t-SNARE coiled-coil homology domain-containing protein n=1 Tax=Hibiscus sabdariffa TaxID=183260 RepID=A0ABR2TS29_9ROSI